MLFAIDQAQYLQGYLPIVFLTKYLETGALPLGSKDRVAPDRPADRDGGDRCTGRRSTPQTDCGSEDEAGPSRARSRARALRSRLTREREPAKRGGRRHGHRSRSAAERGRREGPCDRHGIAPPRASRAGRARRGRARVRLLRDRRRRQQLREHGDARVDPEPGSPPGDPRDRGRAPDDRRRVRPLDRIARRLLGDGDHAPRLPARRGGVRLASGRRWSSRPCSPRSSACSTGCS